MASYHTLHSLCMFDIQHNNIIQQKNTTSVSENPLFQRTKTNGPRNTATLNK